MVLGTGNPQPPRKPSSTGWTWVTGEDSVIPNPSWNLGTEGEHFLRKFPMRVGPKGAAPPVTNLTEARWCGFTELSEARKLTSGGTRFSSVGLYDMSALIRASNNHRQSFHKQGGPSP